MRSGSFWQSPNPDSAMFPGSRDAGVSTWPYSLLIGILTGLEGENALGTIVPTEVFSF
jgi:hypothetical protein